MGAQHLSKLLTRGPVARRWCGGGIESVGCVAQRLEVDPALVLEIVEQQTLSDTSGLGDVAGRDVVKVTGGEVLDSGFEKLAPGQFGLRLSSSRGIETRGVIGVADSHGSILRQWRRTSAIQ